MKLNQLVLLVGLTAFGFSVGNFASQAEEKTSRAETLTQQMKDLTKAVDILNEQIRDQQARIEELEVKQALLEPDVFSGTIEGRLKALENDMEAKVRLTRER